jgi:two-component system, OmpR family, phosphate regulon sensor histidine kinase PhoR
MYCRFHSVISAVTMAAKAQISTRLFVLALVLSIALTLMFTVLGRFAGMPYDWATVFLSLFGSFILSVLTLYFFYYIDITRRLNSLSDKIRQRVTGAEIPRRYSELEDEDGLARLSDRVDFLIESREREIRHFENLDSYRKEYLGNVSHELKTPVFNIQGYIDTLLNGGMDDHAVNRDFLKKAENSIDRLITIIDDLETITQLESGGLQLDLDSFDIAGLAKEVIASMDQPAAKKKISLELDKRYDKPVMVIADKFRIRQVLSNLIANSIKYGVEGGSTTVSIRYLANEVLVDIHDNGVGIDGQHLPRIFERFYRVDKGRSREQGGTGLGLSIVKHIIEAHDKAIGVKSSPGKGTTFTFSLAAAP